MSTYVSCNVTIFPPPHSTPPPPPLLPVSECDVTSTGVGMLVEAQMILYASTWKQRGCVISTQCMPFIACVVVVVVMTCCWRCCW